MDADIRSVFTKHEIRLLSLVEYEENPNQWSDYTDSHYSSSSPLSLLKVATHDNNHMLRLPCLVYVVTEVD